MELGELLLEIKKNYEKYFKNPIYYARKIKNKAKKLLGKDTKIYLFGSIVRKNFTYSSDIDILIVSKRLKNLKNRSRLRLKLLEDIGEDSPFEIHLSTPEIYENFYKKFIKNDYIEI
ncbi:MAG: nucleotidyltransferase domain-containing protein [Minisyncoccia bacterium]